MKQNNLDPGTHFAGRYQIIEEMESHDSGTNYKAYDRKSETHVYLNIFNSKDVSNPELLKRIQDDLQQAQNFSHKNICRIFQFSKKNDSFYFSREYVAGEMLKDIIQMTRGLNPESALKIAIQVGEGISAARKYGLKHLCLSSNKIIVDTNGTARIIHCDSLHDLKIPSKRKPDTVRHREKDIHFMGSLLYEMLTGSPLGVKALSGNKKGIPREIKSIIRKCMNAPRKNRFENIDELIETISKIHLNNGFGKREKRRTWPSLKPLVRIFQPKWMNVLSVISIVVVVGIIAGISTLALNREKPVHGAGIGMKKIVVLPFENLGSLEDDFFSEGMTKEISNRLASLQGLGVISQTSAQCYRDRTKTTKQIAEELDVGYILDGSVRWKRDEAGEVTVRISPKLIWTHNDSQVWSQTYDRNIKDVFSIQSEIAEQIAGQLDLALLEPERQALYQKPTDNVKAYELYLRSLKHENLGWINSDYGEFKISLSLLQKAVIEDTEFALAYAQISYLHSLMYFFGHDRSSERLEKARVSVEKALSLDSSNPDIMHSHALYHYWCLQDYDKTKEIYESIFKTYPNFSSELLGYIHRRQGNWRQCLVELKKASELNPRYFQLAYEVGLTYLALHDYQEAENWYNKALSFNPDRLTPILGKAAIPVLKKGDVSEARALVKSLPDHDLTDYMLFTLDMLEGNHQEILDRLEALPYDSFLFQSSYSNKDLLAAAVYFSQKNRSLQKIHADSACRELEKLVSEYPQDSRYHAALGLAYAYAGKKDQAEEEGFLASQLCSLEKDAVQGPVYLRNLAKIYTIIGEREKAIEQLERLLSIPQCEFLWEMVSVPYLRIDPQWDSLRGNPGFQMLLRTNPDFPIDN